MAERRDDSLQTTLRAQGYRLTPQRRIMSASAVSESTRTISGRFA